MMQQCISILYQQEYSAYNELLQYCLYFLGQPPLLSHRLSSQPLYKMFADFKSFVNADANLERWAGYRRIVQNQPWEIRCPAWDKKLPNPERPRVFFTGEKTQRTALGTTEGVAAALLAGSAPPLRGNWKHFPNLGLAMFVIDPACFSESKKTSHEKMALMTCKIWFASQLADQ